MTSNENPVSYDASGDPSVQTIAIYLRYYLPMDVFPHDSIDLRERSVYDRIQTRIERLIYRRYAVLSRAHEKHLLGVLRDNDVKLIHAHFGPYALEILPVARTMGIPLVATFHGFGASVLLRNTKYVAQLRELFEYAHVLAASRATAERLLGAGAHPDMLSVHYIGVPTETFSFVRRTPPATKVQKGMTIHFLQVSSFVEVKGHRYTLTAFSKLLESHPDCRLTLAGDGPTRPEMEAKSAELGIADRVRFVGRVTPKEVAALLKEADIFLHHSVTPRRGDTEAAATAVAEAMATGLVVIGTNHGGIPEMIDHGANGFLVEERDIEGYVGAMREALSCTEQIGDKAAERIASDFNLHIQNRALIDIYARAIARHL
jgi:glycosyltransferase involved in cell wall biosynthesis